MSDQTDRGTWPDEVSVCWDCCGMRHHPGPLPDMAVGVTFVGRWLDAATFEVNDGKRLEFPPVDADGARRGYVVYAIGYSLPAARGTAQRAERGI